MSAFMERRMTYYRFDENGKFMYQQRHYPQNGDGWFKVCLATGHKTAIVRKKG